MELNRQSLKSLSTEKLNEFSAGPTRPSRKSSQEENGRSRQMAPTQMAPVPSRGAASRQALMGASGSSSNWMPMDMATTSPPVMDVASSQPAIESVPSISTIQPLSQLVAQQPAQALIAPASRTAASLVNNADAKSNERKSTTTSSTATSLPTASARSVPSLNAASIPEPNNPPESKETTNGTVASIQPGRLDTKDSVTSEASPPNHIYIVSGTVSATVVLVLIVLGFVYVRKSAASKSKSKDVESQDSLRVSNSIFKQPLGSLKNKMEPRQDDKDLPFTPSDASAMDASITLNNPSYSILGAYSDTNKPLDPYSSTFSDFIEPPQESLDIQGSPLTTATTVSPTAVTPVLAPTTVVSTTPNYSLPTHSTLTDNPISLYNHKSIMSVEGSQSSMNFWEFMSSMEQNQPINDTDRTSYDTEQAE